MRRLTLAVLAAGCVAGCSEEPPPPSVEAFMEDPILLDATMVRCVANRNSVNYDPECVNAREAVERIAAAEEAARRAALEAESERKRDALRRAQEAADAARRRAEELARLREEAELLGLTAPVLPPESAPAPEDVDGNAPGAAYGEPPPAGKAPLVTVGDAPAGGTVVPPPAAAGGEVAPPQAGSADTLPEPAPITTDLGEIREQLEERRQAAPPESS